MKKFIYILLITILGFSFTSCKKTEYHKIVFEITFLNSPGTGSSSFIDVYVIPAYVEREKAPRIPDRFNIPQVWRYEYLGLEKGQKVHFLVSGQLSYYFEMRIYIDDVEVSYRRVRVSDTSYYSDHVEESYGLNDKSTHDTGIIEFVYQ